MNTQPTLVASMLALTLLAGCSSLAVKEQPGHIRLDSAPAGATAYADGNELGITPLEIVPDAHFRSGFVGMAYRYYGKLSFKKPGCETHAIDVNDHILSRDVSAKLKCDPEYRPPTSPILVQAMPANGNHTERLERLETLRKKALISDAEYQSVRMRILNDL